MSNLALMPRLSIDIDSVALPALELRCLVGLTVQQKLSAPSLCEITLQDPPSRWTQGTAVKTGAHLEIAVGDDEVLFAGQITAIEYSFATGRGRTMRIRGYDWLHSLRKRQPVRAFANMTTADLARELVSDMDLSVEADEPGPAWKKLFQHGQSDFDLLADVAESCGLYLTVHDRTLHLITLAGTGTAIPLKFGDTLFECDAEMNTDTACRKVSSTSWDPSRAEKRDGSATSARSGRTCSAEASPESAGGTGERTLVGDVVPEDAQAEALAQAELDRRAQQEVTVRGVTEGNASLTAGAKVDITGLNESLDGNYVLTSVTHRIDQNGGHLTEFRTAPPARRVRSTGLDAPGMANPSLAWGVVSSIKDPDGLGRVKVKLPAWADVETDWLSVAAAGAGAGKGMICQPDVNDNVVILFANADTAQGLVIGSIFGANSPPDQSGIADGAIKRFSLQTPGGQRVELNDTKRSLRLQNKDGSYCEITPKGMKFHAKCALTIEAPGYPVTIRGNQIHLRKG